MLHPCAGKRLGQHGISPPGTSALPSSLDLYKRRQQLQRLQEMLRALQAAKAKVRAVQGDAVCQTVMH